MSKSVLRTSEKPIPERQPDVPVAATTADATRPSKGRTSRALKKLCEKALVVSDEELNAYLPRELDVSIAEAFLAGATSARGVAEMLEKSEPTIAKALRDPIPCAWIARQIRNAVTKRLGLVDAAMLGQALGGNVAAAKLMYERFDGLGANRGAAGDTNIQVNNYNQFTDADLDAIIAARKGVIDRIMDAK